ncbi:hypothetical protein CONPUDRAFT_75625 [Coniophora puteana RWD-64-598 SS2]|uniref:Uncharacterized protein n=1 Tax=Coniophora puteana (strain RWD-64-598) TaxID=741705 RepID=A0A5M3MFB1_CONPW|nr:uncharacterized protein CONPUDRAFT_75625 [Coniophora puteana RWD-64-598 SS2]EIW77843.1 hypothetical protein CONPUDRAFT_75625 [Coniophora puteana RWD-64-598 SS2]
MDSAVTVDDRSPLISYSGSTAWAQGGASPEYHNTTSGSYHYGDTATFTFTGTWVAVYGTVGWVSVNGLPTTTFTLDGNESINFQGPNATLAQYRYQMYSSSILNGAEHTLVINNTSPTQAPSQIWLDFIEYMPLMPQQASSVSCTQTSSPQISTTINKHHGTSTAALAGGIASGVGGAIILILSCLLFLQRYRKKREKQQIEEHTPRPYRQVEEEPQRLGPGHAQINAAEPPPYNLEDAVLDIS